MFSFQGTFESLSKKFNEVSTSVGTSVNLLKEVVGHGLAFLRESHGGYNMPPAYCQEPPFESILAYTPSGLDRPGLYLYLDFFRSGGPKWTRTTDLTIISRVL